MPIDFNCPLCNHPYRGLKDALAGKRATCKNPACRQVIVIPKPITVPEDSAPPTAEELEAAALSALADEAPKHKEQAPQEKVIAMTCSYCDHKWTEPISKAGKNTLCPNPDCRQRQKVPEVKAEELTDWRQSRTRLPSGAKQNFEKLEGVEDAAEAKFVTGTALREAGATGIEIEPRTLKEKLVIGLTVGAILGGIAFGCFYLFRSRTSGQEEQLMAEARTAFDGSATDLPPEQAALCSSVLNLAGTEYALRHNTPPKLKEAHGIFLQARKDLEPTAGLERHSVAAEVAVAALAFGGTEAEIKEQIRYRWKPDFATGKMRIQERTFTVHDELRNALGLLGSADFDFRAALARRLTRELVKHGQADLAADTVPLALFNEAEQDEARAVVALELFRLDRESPVARATAEELKKKIDGELAARGEKRAAISGNPFPASAHTLFVVLLNSKNREFLGDPPASGPVSDAVRFSNVGIHLLKDNTDEAIKLATRPDRPESQLKSLLLCAEWMPAPAPALDEAIRVLSTNSGRREVSFSPAQILRLSQIAASTGTLDQAKKFTALLPDEGQRAWANADLVRLRLAANPKEKGDPVATDLPEDQKKVTVGTAWGVYWKTRRQAMLSGDRAGEKKATTELLGTLRPFALAGIALGLQDR